MKTSNLTYVRYQNIYVRACACVMYVCMLVYRYICKDVYTYVLYLRMYNMAVHVMIVNRNDCNVHGKLVIRMSVNDVSFAVSR